MNSRLASMFHRSNAGRFLSLFVILPLVATNAASQRQKPMFGPRVDFNPGFVPASINALHPRSDEKATLVVGAAARNEMFLYAIDQSARVTLTATKGTPAPIASVFSPGSSGPEQLAFLAADPPRLHIAKASENAKPITLPAPADADRLAYTDITNDRRSDLLFFGKRNAGIMMHPGTSGGFDPSGTTIIPDLSASDLVWTDLNGDMITDLFVSDWLSNRIILYLGIGKGVFSEQVSVSLPGEPSRLAFHAERGGKNRVAVSLPDLKQVQVFDVNTLGEFRTESILTCPETPGKVRFADINGDGTIELLTATPSELVVFAIYDGRFHREPLLYASEGRIVDWVVADLDGDKRIDAAIVTQEPSRIILLANSAYSGSVQWPAVYAVGKLPRGMAVGDFNADGKEDLSVVSSSPGNLCLFMGRGKGRMDGPVFTPVSRDPVSIKYVAAEQPTFVLSHYPSTHVTVVRSSTTSQFASFVIPTASNATVLSAAIDPARGKLSFLTRNKGDEKRGLSLSLFEEISDEQFIETSLRPNPPRRVTSITAVDMDDDGQRDLVFSSFEKSRGMSTVSFSRGTDRFSFDPHREVFSFADTVGSVRFIRATRIDNDSRADVIVVIGPPKTSVLLLYGSEGGIRDSVEWLRDFDIPAEDALLTEDLNNDGAKDLCFVDSATESVVALFGTGTRGFHPRKTIHQAAGLAAISSGSFTAQGVTDLWVSNQKQGTVTLLRSPF